jgi:MGT family glycosyltransferase
MRFVCCAMPGAGHTHPMLSVAQALTRRGHDVLMVSSWEHQREAEQAGARFDNLPDEIGSPQHSLRLYEDAARMARYLAPRFAAFEPDAVVGDVITGGAGLAAEMIGVPWASLIIHPLHTFSEHLPPFGWGQAPARGLLAHRDEWMRRGARGDLMQARTELNEARVSLGIAEVEALDGMLSPSLLLVATLPSLEIERPDWPARAHVIGPCLWSAPGAPAAILPDGDAPLVLIAASTAHEQRALLDASIDAVTRLRWRGVITAGKTPAPDTLPAHVTVSGFVDHDELIPRCDVVVCNGGHGIVARSLTNGVPLVVVPGHGDQRENGYRVQRAGAGLRVMRPRARAITRALSLLHARPQYRARAQDIAKEASQMDGPARAAELVERLAATKAAVL